MKAAVIGHVEWVEFLRVDHMPAPGEIVHAQAVWQMAGGGGAVAAAQLAKLADETIFFTALSEDEFGHRAHRELTALGVRVEAVFRQEPSRRAITHVDAAGERTITVIGERLGPNASDALPWDELDHTHAVYFTAGDMNAVRFARQARVLVATARAKPVLKGAGVELDALVASSLDANEAYQEGDLNPPPKMVLLTEGSKGGTFQVPGSSPQSFTPPEVADRIVDRYGAGDSFAACLTYALGLGKSHNEAIALASKCGAAVVTGRGPYQRQLTRAELL
jgi:ribokinase